MQALDIEEWSDDAVVLERISQLLRRGSVALVLGAGASIGFGLPDWGTLMDRMCARLQLKRSTLPLEAEASRIQREAYAGDRTKFVAAVRESLYDGFSGKFESLRQNELLASVGAMVMASARGGVRRVVSFNFDDLVEQYLRFHGFVVRSIGEWPAWNGREDVSVLHPHGLLPIDPSRKPGERLILTQADFDAVTGTATEPWHRACVETFSTHFCIFVGLSGADQNLRSMRLQAQKVHIAGRQSSPYWGVRFALTSDERNGEWDEQGVRVINIDSYARVPAMLLAICQTAASDEMLQE